jgi:hypothetical protein
MFRTGKGNGKLFVPFAILPIMVVGVAAKQAELS